MIYTISVLRHERCAENSFWQDFSYEANTDGDTVATALSALNARDVLTDRSGSPARKIEWECSCLQKKCGACAMVINGRPRLACDADLSKLKSDTVKVEPLRKFPVVCDLIVDRSVMFENLKTLKLWLAEDSILSDNEQPLAYEASECIQCGCCLEVCPNFYAGGTFFGMSSVPITTRLLTEMSPKAYKKLAALYTKHTFEGCGKSLACKDVCPKKIDTEKLMVNANALALWKRKRRNKDDRK